MLLRRMICSSLLCFSLGCTAQLERQPVDEAQPDPKAPSTPDPVKPLDPVAPLSCDMQTQRFGAPRVRRLTRAQLDQAASALAGAPISFADNLSPESATESGLLNSASALRVLDADAISIEAAAKALGQKIARDHLGELFPCTTDRLADRDCAQGFIERAGLRAFRRPLTEDEVARYTDLYMLAAQQLGPEQGVPISVEALAQSAPFLYHAELGQEGSADAQGVVRLSAYEIAQALAMTLWGAVPDGALLEQTRDGALDTDEGVAALAAQMLEDERAKRGVSELYMQLYGLRALARAEKNPQLFPGYERLRPVLIAQAQVFFETLIFEREADFQTLMTTSDQPISADLAPLYGIDQAPAAGFTWAARQGRAGVLTLPGVLSSFSSTEDASIAKRGVLVRERLLCEHLGDPPPGAFDNLPERTPEQTERDFFEATTEQGGCAGCHLLINGPGYALDGFDALGAVRLGKDGGPWRTQGQLAGSRDANGPLEGAADMAALLAKSDQAQQCLATQHMRYALGREVNQGDACALSQVMASWEEGGYKLKALMLATVTSDAFLYRQLER